MLKNKNKKGFTLVEMLIVIAIIAVLASIALVSVGGIRKSANDKRRIADLQKVQGYLELYYNQQRSYPAGGYSGLEPIFTAADITKAIPRDVNQSAPYMYAVSSDGQHYVLQATLETSDSILNDANTIKSVPSGYSGDGVGCAAAVKQYCVGM